MRRRTARPYKVRFPYTLCANRDIDDCTFSTAKMSELKVKHVKMLDDNILAESWLMHAGIISSMAAIHLNIEMISSEFFLVICSSLWIGVKLTIFFKKRFQWREHVIPRLELDSAILILIISAHFLLPGVWLLQMITAVIALVSAVWDMYLMLTDLWEYVKSLVLTACMIASWNFERGSCILPSASVFFALTQFLRWPTRLKDRLSEVRIVCGPAFPLSVFATWLKRSEPSGWSYWVLLVAALCSSAAAIFFRPDNSEVLVVFHLPVLSSRNRKVCHAILMTLSLLCVTVHILLYQTFPYITFKLVCIVVIILCVCFFLGATDTSRIIASAAFIRETVTEPDNS